MCLTVKKNETVNVAKEDIHVFKVLRNSNKSIYKRFQYTPHTLFRTRKPLKVEVCEYTGHHEVNVGFHSYTRAKDAVRAEALNINKDYLKLVEFIIPKGAKYIEGMFCNKVSIASTSIRATDLDPIEWRNINYYDHP